MSSLLVVASSALVVAFGFLAVGHGVGQRLDSGEGGDRARTELVGFGSAAFLGTNELAKVLERKGTIRRGVQDLIDGSSNRLFLGEDVRRLGSPTDFDTRLNWGETVSTLFTDEGHSAFGMMASELLLTMPSIDEIAQGPFKARLQDNPRRWGRDGRLVRMSESTQALTTHAIERFAEVEGHDLSVLLTSANRAYGQDAKVTAQQLAVFAQLARHGRSAELQKRRRALRDAQKAIRSMEVEFKRARRAGRVSRVKTDPLVIQLDKIARHLVVLQSFESQYEQSAKATFGELRVLVHGATIDRVRHHFLEAEETQLANEMADYLRHKLLR